VSAKTLERRACESAFELYLQREFVRAKDALEQLQIDYPGPFVATLDMESIEQPASVDLIRLRAG